MVKIIIEIPWPKERTYWIGIELKTTLKMALLMRMIYYILI